MGAKFSRTLRQSERFRVLFEPVPGITLRSVFRATSITVDTTAPTPLKQRWRFAGSAARHNRRSITVGVQLDQFSEFFLLTDCSASSTKG